MFPEVLPALTWTGERFHSDWLARLLAGRLDSKSRPWMKARMPAFPGFAETLADALAAEHAVENAPDSSHRFDPELAEVGRQLSLQSGLDCRQCHAVGAIQPRGDEKTQIALGINFTHIRQRMRYEAYQRFMLDPPRYDINTKMIKLSEDGLSTKLRTVFDADTRRQFEALWHYIQSLGE